MARRDTRPAVKAEAFTAKLVAVTADIFVVFRVGGVVREA